MVHGKGALSGLPLPSYDSSDSFSDPSRIENRLLINAVILSLSTGSEKIILTIYPFKA